MGEPCEPFPALQLGGLALAVPGQRARVRVGDDHALQTVENDRLAVTYPGQDAMRADHGRGLHAARQDCRVR